MNAPAIGFAILLSLIALVFSLAVKRTWVRLVFVCVLWLGVTFSLSFGMGGLRTKIESARASGKSEEYVAGMIHANAQLRSVRLEGLIYAAGLVVLAFYGFIERNKRSKE